MTYRQTIQHRIVANSTTQYTDNLILQLNSDTQLDIKTDGTTRQT